MTKLTSFPDTSPRGGQVSSKPLFQPPDEVLGDPEMSRTEKRALLASWASHAHAVPGLPSMRRLGDGSLVDVDDILQALKALDLSHDPRPSRVMTFWPVPPRRRKRSTLRTWARLTRHRRRDDDDDPPPCPVLAAVPPRTGGGGAFADPEPALA